MPDEELREVIFIAIWQTITCCEAEGGVVVDTDRAHDIGNGLEQFILTNFQRVDHA